MLDDFEQMDRRARDYSRNGQRLLASDLVFSDGIEKWTRARGRAARLAEGETLLAGIDPARDSLMAGPRGGHLGLLLMFVLKYRCRALLFPLPFQFLRPFP